MISTAQGKVSVAAVVDAVNYLYEEMDCNFVASPKNLIQMLKKNLTQAAPEVPWIISRLGLISVCEASTTSDQIAVQIADDNDWRQIRNELISRDITDLRSLRAHLK